MSEFCASVEPPMNEHRKKKINEEEKSCSKDFTKAARPPPKVIEFIEPGKQRKEKIFSMVKKKNFKVKGNQINTRDANEPDFKSIAREVKEFGITGLSFKERRKYQQQKAQALGGRAPKGLKVPYPMLMNRIKRRKEKEKEKLEKEHAMGNFKKNKSNKQRPAPTRTSMGRWVDNSSRGFTASVGKYRAGVQLLSKADILKIRGTKR